MHLSDQITSSELSSKYYCAQVSLLVLLASLMSWQYNQTGRFVDIQKLSNATPGTTLSSWNTLGEWSSVMLQYCGCHLSSWRSLTFIDIPGTNDGA